MPGTLIQSTRARIGVLVGFQVYDGFSPNPFVSAILGGIQQAARALDVDLFAACGIGKGTGPARQIRPGWPHPGTASDFVPVGPWNTDGLIVLNPLRSDERESYIRDIRSNGFPVLCIGHGSGSPSLDVDNAGGIRSCLQHLVGHGHRDIAFVAGDPGDPGDSSHRLEAFRRGVNALGLSPDPRLIEWGQHWQGGGHDAMERILASGVKFTAVMCSNDESAAGVLDALRAHGIRVPADVAVTGFDDHALAETLVPPLTTVHYPLAETGQRALSSLYDNIRGSRQPLPIMDQIDTWLVTRRSCGCLERSPEGSRPPEDPDPLESPRPGIPEVDHSIAEAMANAVVGILPFEHLVSGFRRGLAATDSSAFGNALMELIQTVELAGDDSHVLQAALSALRLHLPDLLRVRTAKAGATPAAHAHAEDLLHYARTLFSESVRRQGARRLMFKSSENEAMGRLTSRLLSSLEEQDILATLDESLPPMRIRSWFVGFFEPSDSQDPFGTCVAAATHEDNMPLRFTTREFPPPGLYPSKEPLSLAVLPLCFQDEQLGFVAMDAGNLEPLAMVVRQLSGAVKSARLHAEVRSLSLHDALTGIANRRYFDVILQKEVERSQRYRRNLGVILIDVDLFKNYNDEYGHLAGDEALKEIARCIDNATRRDADVASRVGGEEFAVILPETDTEGARIVAERIRADVARSTAFMRPMSVSLGVASRCGPFPSARSLVDDADKALYAAKGGGRNRVEVSLPDDSPG